VGEGFIECIKSSRRVSGVSGQRMIDDRIGKMCKFKLSSKFYQKMIVDKRQGGKGMCGTIVNGKWKIIPFNDDLHIGLVDLRLRSNVKIFDNDVSSSQASSSYSYTSPYDSGKGRKRLREDSDVDEDEDEEDEEDEEDD